MKHLAIAAWVFVCLSVPTELFGQGGAGTLGTLTGIVSDSSKARLPGVTIRVANEDTGVANSMLTNDSGDYSFLLSPGNNYRITAEFPGFQKFEITKITVRAADTARADIVLEIGDIKVTKTVEANRNPLFQGTTQDIGNLLDESQIQGLPLVGNDPLALITTLPGYRANPLGHEFDTLGGLPMTMVNTVRDGLSVTDELYPGGVGSNTILNPDMISEIRLILAPVDAEAGRGNGQVQITTKSGTNKFTWNINYNLRQNALNALGPSPDRVKQPFGATFQYIVSVGGPIIKNRTFYFVNWDHQLRFARSGGGTGTNGFGGYLAVPALTDPARNGIFRYFDGWISQPCIGLPTSPANGWQVDCENPTVVPQFSSTDTSQPYTGALMCYSVFGTIKFDGTPFDPNTDCGAYTPRSFQGGSDLAHWLPDPSNPRQGVGVCPQNRCYAERLAAGESPVYSWEQFTTLPDGTSVQLQRPPDRTGYIQRLLGYMPRVNTYRSSNQAGGQVAGGSGTAGADGLNRAAHEWVRGLEGLDNRNTFRGGTFGFGTSLDQTMVGHKVVNIKIDHIIDSKSRVTVGTSFQDDQNSRQLFQSRWPDGINGFSTRAPRVLTINGLTTFSPSLVNEARVGLNLNRSMDLPPWDNPDASAAAFARSFLQQGWVDPNCANGNGSDVCQKYNGITPIYFTPGAPGTASFGFGSWMDFTDNILPAAVNQGFANSGTFPSLSQCGGTGASAVDNTFGYNCSSSGKLINFADTLSWNRGSHSIRSGVEFRLTRTQEDSSSVIPNATSGASFGTATPLVLITGAGAPAEFGSTRAQRVAQTSADLLYLLSGSVQQVQQTFWVNGVNNYVDGTWETWSKGEGRKTRHTLQNEYAFFVKDDWKIGRRLTLNLGVRYENYGNLYIKGFATGVVDQGMGLFGTSRTRGPNPFDYWLTPGNMYLTGYGNAPPAIDVRGQFLPNGQPSYIPGNCTPGTPNCGTNAFGNVSVGGTDVQFVGATSGGIWSTLGACVYGVQQTTALVQLPMSNCDPSLLTSHIFVGPGSDHPDLPVLYRDRNNIGPAIGFSYRAPFIGNRILLVRGGFQFTFGSAGRDKTVGTGSGAQLGQQSAGKAFGGQSDQVVTSCGNAANAAQCLVDYDPATAPAAYALTLADLPNVVPLQTTTQRPSLGGYASGVVGARTLLVQDFAMNRAVTATAFAPDYKDARTENYTFSISTNLTRNSTLAISYVGTLGKNRPTAVNINMPSTYNNPELVDALNRTRAGEDSPLFDQMLAGLNLTGLAVSNGYGPIGTCVTPNGPNVAALLADKQAAFDAGLRDAGNCGRNQIYQSGSAHLRNASNTTSPGMAVNLANGNYAAVVFRLSTLNPPGTAPAWQNATWAGAVNGRLQRNGCDRMASATSTLRYDQIGFVAIAPPAGVANSANTSQVRCLPEDWIVMNPALDTGVSAAGNFVAGTGALYKANWGWTNYQQAQFQYTLRLAAGVNLQATYLTSKTLALPRDFYKTNSVSNNAGAGGAFGVATGFSDPRTEETRRKDYGESSDSLKHALRMNGVFGLPFGPGKPLLSKAPGWVTNILGGWQMGIIFNAQSGQPFSIFAGDTLYGISSGVSSGCNAFTGSLGVTGTGCVSGLSFPDIVSPLWSNPKGHLQKNGPDGTTTYYGSPSPFSTITDPQCTNALGHSALSDPGGTSYPQCSLRALVLKVPAGTPGAFFSSEVDSGATPVLIMLQNPMPGKQGSLGAQTLRQPGRTYLDANLAKTFMFTERRGVQIRIDATNVLNHPTPSDLYFSLGPGGSFNDQTNASQSALSSGCFSGNINIPGNAFCGRQVQFGVRMINN